MKEKIKRQQELEGIIDLGEMMIGTEKFLEIQAF